MTPIDRTTVRFPLDELIKLQQAVAAVDLMPVREAFAAGFAETGSPAELGEYCSMTVWRLTPHVKRVNR